jgi:energy-coupling factor transport system substrate-specific component
LAINLQHWLACSIATSLAFDIPRAVLTIVLISVLGKPTLAVLRRAGRRAVFDSKPVASVGVSRA